MRHIITSLFFLVVSVTTFGQMSTTGTSGFYHPGCLHSEKDFDRIREDIKNHTRKGVTDSWNIFKDNDKVRQTDFFLATNPGIRHLERFNMGGNFANCHRDFGASIRQRPSTISSGVGCG
jgi:hypothetical protein